MYKNGVWNVKSSQLNLVDLAGSERQKDTNTVGQRLKVSCDIAHLLNIPFFILSYKEFTEQVPDCGKVWGFLKYV